MAIAFAVILWIVDFICICKKEKIKSKRVHYYIDIPIKWHFAICFFTLLGLILWQICVIRSGEDSSMMQVFFLIMLIPSIVIWFGRARKWGEELTVEWYGRTKMIALPVGIVITGFLAQIGADIAKYSFADNSKGYAGPRLSYFIQNIQELYNYIVPEEVRTEGLLYAGVWCLLFLPVCVGIAHFSLNMIFALFIHLKIVEPPYKYEKDSSGASFSDEQN